MNRIYTFSAFSAPTLSLLPPFPSESVATIICLIPISFAHAMLSSGFWRSSRTSHRGRP